MTERDKLLNQISGILLSHDCLTDEIQSEIFLALDLYEVTKRSTEIVQADEQSNENLIREFAAAKAVAGRSPKTIRQYVLALKRFTRTVPVRLVDVKAADIRKYTAIRLTRDGLHGQGLINERDYLSSFFEWAVKAEIMVRNPVKQVEAIKLAKVPKKAYTDLECEKLRKACRNLQETAIVETLFSTACRVSELCGILTSSIDNRRILICGKGKKYGTVYLDSKAQLAIDACIESRDDNSPFLFPGRSEGKPLSSRTVERILKDIGKRAGVSNVHAHRFRRTAATMALRRGMPLEMVSKMLRHENLQTTMRYLDLTEEELFYQHQKFVV